MPFSIVVTFAYSTDIGQRSAYRTGGTKYAMIPIVLGIPLCLAINVPLHIFQINGINVKYYGIDIIVIFLFFGVYLGISSFLRARHYRKSNSKKTNQLSPQPDTSTRKMKELRSRDERSKLRFFIKTFPAFITVFLCLIYVGLNFILSCISLNY